MKAKLLGHSANDLFWFILPLVLPSMLSRYDLNYTEAGGILTIYLLFTAAGSFAAGKLSDRFSRKRILSYGLFAASAGLISASFAPGLPVFLILISLTAIGVSTFHPVMYAVIDESYPERKSRVMGLYECFGTAAILLMFLINGYLLKRIGVRGVMIVTAIPAIVMGLVYAFSSSIPDTASIESEPSGGVTDSGPADPDHRIERGDALRLVLFLISIILRIISVTALLNFLPTIFVSFFGMETDRAAYATAFYFAGGISGSIIAGKLSEHFNSFGIILVGTVFIGFTLLVLAGNLPVWIYLIIITLFGAFASGCLINQNLLMSRLSGSLGRGEVFGIMMGFMTFTSAVSPAVFGFVLDFTGYREALYIFSLPLLASILILSWLLKTDRAVKSPAGVSL